MINEVEHLSKVKVHEIIKICLTNHGAVIKELIFLIKLIDLIIIVYTKELESQIKGIINLVVIITIVNYIINFLYFCFK